jgi:insertion element IS1 protein InsB
LGDRSEKTCKQIIDKIGLEGKTFLTDDWDTYHKLIPQDQLFTGKDLTFPIEQDNSDVRHHLARMTRRTKVVSKSERIVNASLKLANHFRCKENVAKVAQHFKSIFK